MADAEATGVFRVKADTSQAVKSLDSVGAAWGRVGEAQKKTADSFGAAFTRTIDNAATGLAKFNLAIGGLEKAFAIAKSTISAALDASRMERMIEALPTGAINRLSAATQGLFSQAQLLRAATQGMNGDFRLTEQQMVVVLKASTALAQQYGGQATEYTEKLLESTVKFETEGLAKLGIAFTKTGDRSKDLTALLGALDEKAKDVGGVDERTASLIKLDNSLSDIGVVMSQVLVPVISVIVDQVGELVEYVPDLMNLLGLDGDKQEKLRRERARQIGTDAHRKWSVENGLGYTIDNAPGDLSRESFEQKRRRRVEEVEMALDAKYGAGMLDEAQGAALSAQKRKPGPYRGHQSVFGFGLAAWDSEALDELEANQMAPDGSFGGAAWDSGALGALEANQSASGRNYLNNSFDPGANGDALGRIKQQLGDTTSAAGAAYATLAGGITAAVDAAISGSDSIGKAAAKASAQILKSLAVEATGRAVYEGALAIGSLAMGDVKGAGLHGLAAAKYAAAAAGLGVLSAGLNAAANSGGGSGAGASSGPAGGGFVSGRGGSSSDGGGQTVIVNFGDGFVGDHDKVVDFIARAVRTSERSGRSRPASSFSSGFSG